MTRKIFSPSTWFKGDPAPVAEKAIDFRAEGMTFGEPSTGAGMAFQSIADIGGVKVPDIVQACVRQIVARAIQAEFAGNNSALMKVEKINMDYTANDFWTSVFEAYLVTGNVLFFRDINGELQFSSSALSVKPSDGMFGMPTGASGMNAGSMDVGTPLVRNGKWFCNVYYPSASASRAEMVNFKDGGLARWEARQGRALLGESPLKIATPFINAYQEAAEMLHSYGARGHKVARVVKQTAARSSRDESKRYLKEVQTMLEPKGSFRTIFAEHGFDMDQLPAGAPPALRDTLEQAAIGVCRIYGVPPDLVGVERQGDRQQPHELEDSLMRRAVTPMLLSVASAVSRAINSKVTFNTSMIGRPSFDGMAERVMRLGQSGAVRIDELRALIGLPPLPNGEGDRFPETAGSGYRDGGDNPAPGSENAADNDRMA